MHIYRDRMHASKFQMQAGILTIKQKQKTAGPVPKIQSLISPIKPSRHTQAFQQKQKIIKHCLSI